MQILEQKFVGVKIQSYVCIVNKLLHYSLHIIDKQNIFNIFGMNIYLTKEKLSYEGGQDLYIGKINRKRLYCLNDVCRIFGIFFRDTKKSLEEGDHYVCGIMIKRKKRCSENTFTDYDGLIEVLLMSRYDKSSSFKKWIDSIPETSFKKCQKYTKKESKSVRPNANKNNKSSQVSNNEVETGKQRVGSVETKTVEFPKPETSQVESSESRVTQSSSQQSSLENEEHTNRPTPSIKPKVSSSTGKPIDAILEYCKINDFSIDTFLFFLTHVRNMTKERYMEGGMGYMEAVHYLKWLDNFGDLVREVYKTSPYYLQRPSLAALGEKYKVS